jgi:hypothetical protein
MGAGTWQGQGPAVGPVDFDKALPVPLEGKQQSFLCDAGDYTDGTFAGEEP